MTTPDRIYLRPIGAEAPIMYASEAGSDDGQCEAYIKLSLYSEVVAQRDAAAARIVALNKALQETASILRREIVRTSEIYPEMDDRKRVVTLRAVTSEYAEIEKEILGILRREEVPLNLSE